MSYDYLISNDLVAASLKYAMLICITIINPHFIDQNGAMQGQCGTFGFHEQGESTRPKIYFYVTAI